MNEQQPPRKEAGQGEFVTLARVTKTQGRKGEVAATLLTDFPERFATRKRLLGLDPGGRRHELELEDYWLHKGGVVLKFAGVDSISQAETLVGWEIQIPRAERAELPQGSVYIGDLIGCAVLDGGREIGRIQDVQFGAGAAPLLVVVAQSKKEILVPFAWEFLEGVNLERKQVSMKLPEGLLEIDTLEPKPRRNKRD